MKVIFTYRYYTLFIIVLSVIIISSIGIKKIRFELFPLNQAYRIYLNGEVDPKNSLAQTATIVRQIEEEIGKLPDGLVKSFKSTIGIEGDFKGTRYESKNSFLTVIILTHFRNRDWSAIQVKNHLKASLSKLKGIRSMRFTIDNEGPPVGPPIEVRIGGTNETKRETMAKLVANKMHFWGMKSAIQGSKTEEADLKIYPNLKRLDQAGISIKDLADTLQIAISGKVINHLHSENQILPVRVQYTRPENTAHPLSDISITNNIGNFLKIEKFIKLDHETGIKKYWRFNGIPSTVVKGEFSTRERSASETKMLTAYLAQLQRQNPSLSFTLNGEGQQAAKSIREISNLLYIAILAIYGWLVFQLNSFILPIFVLISIPFGILAILMAFILHQFSFSLLAVIGIIGVTGVVVNDSLILIDHLKSEDLETPREIYEAQILESARKRFRPILLTTLTTVAGTIPTAYGWMGESDAFISPLVFSITWGLIIATPSTLLMIPLSYVIRNDLSIKFSKNLRTHQYLPTSDSTS